MALFGKNKNKGTEESEQETQVVQETAKPAKKKKDTMAGVIHETVFETVMDTIAKNEKFKLQKDGETVYAAMLLSAEDIGGLSKKTKNDESKGTIVEYINGGTFTTLATDKLLADEKIAFIPTPSTLHTMTEFTLLHEAPYELCYIHSDGGVELTGKKIDWRDMNDVASDVISIREIAGLENDVEEIIEEEPEETSSQPAQEQPTPIAEEPTAPPVSGIPDPEEFAPQPPEQEPDDFDDEEDYQDESDDFNNEFSDDEYDNGDDYDEDNYDDDGYDEDDEYDESEEDEDGEEDDDYEITEEAVNDAYVRKFYSDDLGLEVSTEPFDAEFKYGNSYIPLNENRPDSWINKQLNEMSVNANIDIKRTHDGFIRDARNLYINLMNKTCDAITAKYDITNPNTELGSLYLGILEAKKDSKSKLTDEVGKRVAEIKNKYEQERNTYIEHAKHAAGSKYDELHRAAHMAEINDVRLTLEDEIEKHFNEEIRKIKGQATIDAKRDLDYAITAALQEVTEVYARNFETEKELIKKHEKAIQDYIDENRKSDIAHDKIRQDELDERKRSDAVTREYEARINEMKAEFEAKQKQLESENNSRIKSTEERMRAYKQECDKQVADAEKKSEDLQKQLDNMLDKYAKLDESKKSEYASRITELQNERDAMVDRCEHLENTHKKSNVVSSFLVVAIAVASIAVGVIVGSFLNLKGNADNTKPAQTQQIVASVDDVDRAPGAYPVETE